MPMYFLPRDAIHKRGLCRRAVSVCPSVRPSVRVTFVYSVETNERIFKKVSQPGSHTILLFFYRLTLWQYSDGGPNSPASATDLSCTRFWIENADPRMRIDSETKFSRSALRHVAFRHVHWTGNASATDSTSGNTSTPVARGKSV